VAPGAVKEHTNEAPEYKAPGAVKEHTNEVRGGGRDTGVKKNSFIFVENAGATILE